MFIKCLRNNNFSNIQQVLMAMSQKGSYKNKMLKLVKSTDMFGIPVSLTYKNENNIKSFPGGVMTLVTRLLILIYLFNQIVNVFQNSVDIQNTFFRRDFNTDSTQYNLTQSNFNFGIRLDYIFKVKEPLVQQELDQYVYLEISQNIYSWVNDQNGNSIFQKTKIKT